MQWTAEQHQQDEAKSSSCTYSCDPLVREQDEKDAHNWLPERKVVEAIDKYVTKRNMESISMTTKKKLNKSRSQVSSIYKQLEILYCNNFSFSQPKISNFRSLARAGIASWISLPRATIAVLKMWVSCAISFTNSYDIHALKEWIISKEILAWRCRETAPVAADTRSCISTSMLDDDATAAAAAAAACRLTAVLRVQPSAALQESLKVKSHGVHELNFIQPTGVRLRTPRNQVWLLWSFGPPNNLF